MHKRFELKFTTNVSNQIPYPVRLAKNHRSGARWYLEPQTTKKALKKFQNHNSP